MDQEWQPGIVFGDNVCPVVIESHVGAAGWFKSHNGIRVRISPTVEKIHLAKWCDCPIWQVHPDDVHLLRPNHLKVECVLPNCAILTD